MYCIQVEGKTFFLDGADNGAMTKDSNNCKTLTQENIRTASEKFNCKVTAVVTDNAKNMDKVRQELKKEDPDLQVYGSSSYMLNLLGGDITPAPISKHVVEIQKYFGFQKFQVV